MLSEYAYRLPGDLPHGVKFVKEGGPDDDFYMGTNGKGGFYFREVEYGTFNSRRDLFGGLAKCADKQRPQMTRDEEYALESLWHEIWHNRQTGMDAVAALEPTHPVRRFAETLNQAAARLTYPSFIERLGGQSVHQDWVIDNGYGYAATVSRFWQIVRECGLSPLDVAGELATVNREANLLEGAKQVAKLLGRRSGYPADKIQAALDLLLAKDALFLSRLGGIKS
ncbi:MAG: hypothetical protein JZU52_10700 [Lamprocystis purpurea]|uniref:hypothetical protein n=1 Tax=Lamprocystis purpurea TaxID=61598 RepID=UPI000A045549|nr:hypothetical protein [Lamprocystis purpurea]MBV5274083.1 hypothetical protein [Lamprocystis purpurea]